MLSDRLPVIHLNHSTTNRLHPNIRVVTTKNRFTAMLVVFQSLISYDIDIWYDDESGELSYQGTLAPGEITSTTAYENNLFIFTPLGNSKKVIKKYRMSAKQVNVEIFTC